MSTTKSRTAGRPGNGNAKFSAIFGQSTGVVMFDDVFVPHERVFLAGDSAHCHSPAGGRGMNLGIADAVHFANCLLHDRLDDYAQIRHDEGRKTIALSEGARKIVQSKSKWQRSALVGFARLASHIPPINRMALRRVLDVS